jgi:hypothetical protein
MRNFLKMNAIVSVIVLTLLSVISVSAQNEADLKQRFEGREVVLKIDMPATKDGVNVYTNKELRFDYGQYASRLRDYGVSIRKGEQIMITKVKIKGNHIEFQLGGGGYGVAGDETDYVSVTSTPKHPRERELERRIKEETDKDRLRRLQNELWRLQNFRYEQDRRNRAEAEFLREIKRERIAEKALHSGSRFNIHFDKNMDKSQLTPEWIMDALERYLEFDDEGQGYSDSNE